jgi:ferric-dicitrate binding protein FerR (iron transport regulator)
MIERDDPHLKRAFEALRREDAAGCPSFQATVAGARARRAGVARRRALGLVAVVVVAVIAVVVASTWRVQKSDRLEIDLATVRWQAPTDFLLKLPGVELLRSIPQLGPRGLDRRIL